MSLKSRFFKKPWQHANADKRLAAVRDEDDPELTSALPELAEHDPSAGVRLAALRRINTEPFWLDARLRESDREIIEAADRFLLRAVVSESADQLADARIQWFERIESGETIRTLALKARDPALRQRALERIQSQGFLGDCYASEADAELAAGVLERIDQISTLERLHQELKKSSKSKSKAVMARIQAIQSASGQYDAGLVDAERLVDQAETLARGENLDQRGSLLPELRQAWDRLESVPERLEARFRGALSIVEAAIARPAPSVSDASSAAAATEAGTDGGESSMQGVADAIRSELRRNRKGLKPQKLLADWDRAWNALGRVGPADLDVKNDMLPILKELQAQVQRNITTTSAAANASDSKVKAGNTANVAAFSTELDALAALLEAGDLAEANQHRNRIRGRLHSLPVKQRPRDISGRLQRLEGRLKELRDYQHWSHNEHRDELIGRVSALPDSGQHPDAIAAALKEARAEWQRLEKLEILPGDKRKYAAPGGQWRRFQEACSTAFDTAKPYFEKRQTVQEETLSRLEAFIEAGMEQARDESLGPKELMPVMRKARQAIRRLDDLPPKSRGAGAGGLRDLMNTISKRLDSAFEQVELTKRRLINEARALGQESDLKTAIDRAKGLQADWKRAGQGRRASDQKLWKEFRAEIDPLFDQLDGQRKEREQANQEVIKKIEQLCEQAEGLTGLPDDELSRARGQMQGLVDSMGSLRPSPPALVKRFEQARRAFSDRQAEIRKAREEQAVRDLADCIEAVQAAFAKRIVGQPVDKDRIGKSCEQVPAGLQAAVEAVTDESNDVDQLKAKAEANLESALQIAVEFEFLSGLDSPTEEKNRRMDFQVKRLAARMSERSGQQDLGSELAELEGRWYRSLPLPEANFSTIQARIEKCQAVIRQMMGIA